MKVKAEIEIPYMEEGGSLDEKIKDELVEHCVSVLEKNVLEELNKVIKESFVSKIENKIDEILHDFLFSKRILITDSWGDKKEEYENGMELLKTRFDEFIGQKVDQKGTAILNQCGYGNRYDSRIEYLIKQNLGTNFDTVQKEVKKNILTEIDSKIKDIKANMAKETLSNLYDKIDIEAGIKAKKKQIIRKSNHGKL